MSDHREEVWEDQSETEVETLRRENRELRATQDRLVSQIMELLDRIKRPVMVLNVPPVSGVMTSDPETRKE